MWKELNSREPDDFCFFPALKCGEEKQAVGEKKYWITKLVYGVSLFIYKIILNQILENDFFLKWVCKSKKKIGDLNVLFCTASSCTKYFLLFLDLKSMYW